jgi:hypothetical protein
VIWQDAIPTVLVAAKVQFAVLPNDPAVGDAVKLTDPVGVVAPLDAVSVTVALHVVAFATLTDAGEHEAPVDVESCPSGLVVNVAVTD